MAFQIDQSGKIEQTSLDTIIALSNSKKYCVVLKRRTKRLLQEEFRLRKKPRMFIFDTFCALLAIILLKVKPASSVFIDKEYFGNEDLIKARILEFINKLSKSDSIPEIEFILVGKSSPAHLLAAKVGKKEVKPDKVVTLEEISTALWPKKRLSIPLLTEPRAT